MTNNDRFNIMYKLNYNGDLLWHKIIGNSLGSSHKSELYMDFVIDSTGFIYSNNKYKGSNSPFGTFE